MSTRALVQPGTALRVAARSGPKEGRIGPLERLIGKRAMSSLTIETQRRAFFTPETLASYLQVSDRMIRKWVAEGRLRSYKLDGCRRFDPSDVDSFVAQFRDRREAMA